MTIRWLLAVLHLLALGIGLGAIAMRARGLLSDALDGTRLRSVFAADALWGIAAIIWISTGLWRLFGETEKSLAYYMGSRAFWIKMTLLIFILLLEIGPMVVLIRWRIALRRAVPIDLRRAGVLGGISLVQTGLVIAMVVAATAMARGIGT
jgi:putative membrane protein